MKRFSGTISAINVRRVLKATSISAACVLVGACASAARRGEQTTLYPPGFQGPADIATCEPTSKLFRALLKDQRSEQFSCHWRLTEIPKKFPEFSLPAWRPWPQEKITFDVVADVWRSNFLAQYRYSDQKLSLDKMLEQQGIFDDIRRGLSMQAYSISEASLDMDNDGVEERVLRLDNQECAHANGETAISPNYPMYAVLLLNGHLDAHKFLLGISGGSEILTYKGKVKILNVGPRVGVDDKVKENSMIVDLSEILYSDEVGVTENKFHMRTLCAIQINED